MSELSTPNLERLTELMAERLERDLTESEQTELDRLLAQAPGWREDDFELAAAAAFVAWEPNPAPMPADLASRISTAVLKPQEPHPEPSPAPVIPLQTERTSSPLLQWGGWIAAAAAILIAVIVWRNRPVETVKVPVPVPVVAPKPKTVAELRRALEQKPGVVKLAWTGTKDPLAKAAQGDVIWDPASQKGYMRFAGLPSNDATKNQYQLWIFDAQRNDKHPVDGGVFDIDGSSEVIIPIDAKLKVNKATLFAVTYEKPGGVVVSSRERLVVLAKVEG